MRPPWWRNLQQRVLCRIFTGFPVCDAAKLALNPRFSKFANLCEAQLIVYFRALYYLCRMKRFITPLAFLMLSVLSPLAADAFTSVIKGKVYQSNGTFTGYNLTEYVNCVD